MKRGEIIIVEDDADDRLLLRMVFDELSNENKNSFFTNGELAFKYLEQAVEAPFLIISDINMPRMSGIELCEKIRLLTTPMFGVVPFIFMSTGDIGVENNHLPMQGFFSKPNNYDDLKQLIKVILDYWKRSTFPERRNRRLA